jgi:leucyl-tRNA synthetase
MVLANAYRDADGSYHPPEDVDLSAAPPRVRATGKPVEVLLEKMGKSKKNGGDLDAQVARYGADTLRAAVLFIGPPEAGKQWEDAMAEGPRRFLARAWRLLAGDEDAPAAPLTDAPANGALRKALHRAIDGVTRDMAAVAYNTAVSKLMVLLNEMAGSSPLPREAADAFVRMLCPIAPHVAEELWERLGGQGFCSHAAWPVADPAALVDDTVALGVQVNGKVRGEVVVPADATDAEILAAARRVDNVARHLEGKAVVKEIVVPRRLVGFVVR